MNVWQKLQQARVEFLKETVTKSGKNTHSSYLYFELSDIVPPAERIFGEVGLVAIPVIMQDYAVINLHNVDKPDEVITFTCPFITMQPVNKTMNEMQALGASLTYIRRYLWMLVLDICDPDSVDSGLHQPTPTPPTAPPKAKLPPTAPPKVTPPKPTEEKVEEKVEELPKPPEKPTPTEEKVVEQPKKSKPVPLTPPKSKSKAPLTPVEKQQVVNELTKPDEGNATPEMVEELKAQLKKLRLLDPDQDQFISSISMSTKAFTNISTELYAELMEKVTKLFDNYAVEE